MWRQCTLLVMLILGWIIWGGVFVPVSAQTYGVCEPYRLQGAFCAQVNIYQTLITEAYANQPPTSSPQYNAWMQHVNCLHSMQQIAAQYCSQFGGDGTFPTCTHEYSPGWNCQALSHYMNFLNELNALPPTNVTTLIWERDRLRNCLTFIINNLQANCSGGRFNVPSFNAGSPGGGHSGSGSGPGGAVGGGTVGGGTVGGGYNNPGYPAGGGYSGSGSGPGGAVGGGAVGGSYNNPGYPGGGYAGGNSGGGWGNAPYSGPSGSPTKPGAPGMDECEFMVDIPDVADHCVRARLIQEKMKQLELQNRLSEPCRYRLEQMYMNEAAQCEQEGNNPAGQPTPIPLKPPFSRKPVGNDFNLSPCDALAIPEVADPCVALRYVVETLNRAMQMGAPYDCLRQLKQLFYEKQEACRKFSDNGGHTFPYLPEDPR